MAQGQQGEFPNAAAWAAQLPPVREHFMVAALHRVVAALNGPGPEDAGAEYRKFAGLEGDIGKGMAKLKS